MTLAADFAWFPDFQASGKLCLRIGGMYGKEVVLVSPRVDGAGWCTTTNRHKDWACRGTSVLASKALALRMANRWAEIHAERLIAEVASTGVGPLAVTGTCK